jgi:hypothetical protein
MGGILAAILAKARSGDGSVRQELAARNAARPAMIR